MVNRCVSLKYNVRIKVPPSRRASSSHAKKRKIAVATLLKPMNFASDASRVKIVALVICPSEIVSNF